MPETRYIRHFEIDGTETWIPYEVSDEQLDSELEEQAREEAIAEITAKKKAEIIARK